jgi:pyrroloquinoline quinone biosynthesis protein D
MNPIPGDSRPALAPGVRLQADRATGEPILLYPEGVMFLNETALEVVTRCNGLTTVDAVIAALAAEYEVGEDAIRQDVSECLTELQKQRLVKL